MKSGMYSSTVVKMNTYDATARPKAVRPREVRGSHSHAADADGIKINMNMFICILGDFDLQYYYVHSRTGVTVFALYMLTYTYKVANRFDHTHTKSLPPQHFRHGSCSTDSCSLKIAGQYFGV